MLYDYVSWRNHKKFYINIEQVFHFLEVPEKGLGFLEMAFKHGVSINEPMIKYNEVS